MQEEKPKRSDWQYKLNRKIRRNKELSEQSLQRVLALGVDRK